MRSAFFDTSWSVFNGAFAQTMQGFTWEQNSRFELKVSINNKLVTVRVICVMEPKSQWGGKEGYSAELKSYTTELFVVAVLTLDTDETGYIFLLERPEREWIAMNTVGIRARKLNLMKDFETSLELFKTKSNFSLANSLRKTRSSSKSTPKSDFRICSAHLKRR